MRKCVILFLIVMLTFCNYLSLGVVKADSTDVNEFENNVFDSLNDIDFSKVDTFLDDLLSHYGFSDISFSEQVKLLLSGKVDISVNSIVSSVIKLIFNKLHDVLPSVISILAIGLICMFLVGLTKSITSDMLEFVSVSAVILISIVSFKSVLTIVSGVTSALTNFISIITPIMLSLLATMGSGASVGVISTLLVTISTIISFVFNKLLYPIVIISYVLLVCSSIASNINLSRLNSFFASTYKFIIGVTFTIFFGILGLQSIAISKFDSLSIRATKYAISSFIPFIGSFISQGFDYVVMGSMLIKNAIGVVGIVVIVLIVFIEIINMYLLKLSYDLLSGVLEFMGSDKISSYVDKFSKLLTLPIILLISVGLIYVIAIVVIISTANIGVI